MSLTYSNYKVVPDAVWKWPSFSPREMACKGTGKLMINSDAMDKLQALRDALGKPLIITSAYRSPEHNRAVGGATKSKHMAGIAFDVRMDNHEPEVFEFEAMKAGFTGFGYYPKSGFMHIDTGPERTWGTPWPRSVTDWPVEPPRQPETLAQDKDAKAAAGAGVAGVVAVAADYLPILGSLGDTAQIIAVLAAAAFIGYILWKRA